MVPEQSVVQNEVGSSPQRFRKTCLKLENKTFGGVILIHSAQKPREK